MGALLFDLLRGPEDELVGLEEGLTVGGSTLLKSFVVIAGVETLDLVHFVLQLHALGVHLLHGLQVLLAEGLVHVDELVVFIPLELWDQRIR